MDVGHNGGPQSLTDRVKVIRLRKLFARTDLTATQKCVGAHLILEGDKNGGVVCSTQDLQQAASVKRRETVFNATKVLRDIGLIERDSDRGQRGRYNILPDHVMSAVEDAYQASKSGAVQQDHSDAKQYGSTAPVEQGEVVRSKRTGTVQPDHLERTGTVQPDRSRAPAHARIDTPFGSNSFSSSRGGVGESELPEIDGLNGSTAKLADQLAGYLAGDLRPKEHQIAWDILRSNVEIYGPERVRIGMVELQSALASRKIKPTQDVVRAFNAYIKGAKLPKTEESIEDAERKAALKRLDAMCAGSWK